MAEMTMDDMDCLNGLRWIATDQRERYLAANPGATDDFKPLDQCTKDDLLAELNSEQFRSAG